MKLMSFAATLNAILAMLSALLGAAPFTPAIVLFAIYAPLAALSAALGYTPQALIVITSTMAAWLLSPIRFEAPVPHQLLWLGAWVVGWALLAGALCVTPWRNGFWSALGRPIGGA
jgi:hypothetical protein